MHRADAFSHLRGHLISDARDAVMKVIETSSTGSAVSFFWVANNS
jgi:hypothetical protein